MRLVERRARARRGSGATTFKHQLEVGHSVVEPDAVAVAELHRPIRCCARRSRQTVFPRDELVSARSSSTRSFARAFARSATSTRSTSPRTCRFGPEPDASGCQQSLEVPRLRRQLHAAVARRRLDVSVGARRLRAAVGGRADPHPGRRAIDNTATGRSASRRRRIGYVRLVTQVALRDAVERHAERVLHARLGDRPCAATTSASSSAIGASSGSSRRAACRIPFWVLRLGARRVLRRSAASRCSFNADAAAPRRRRRLPHVDPADRRASCSASISRSRSTASAGHARAGQHLASSPGFDSYF